MNTYQVQWRMGFGYDWKPIAIVFKTKEDAYRYGMLTLSPYFEGGENWRNHVRVDETPVTVLPYWASLNPYIARIFNGELYHIISMATHEMFLQKLIFQEMKEVDLKICFWDSGDLERAKVLAQSMYDGWRAAKDGIQSDI